MGAYKKVTRSRSVRHNKLYKHLAEMAAKQNRVSALRASLPTTFKQVEARSDVQERRDGVGCDSGA